MGNAKKALFLAIFIAPGLALATNTGESVGSTTPNTTASTTPIVSIGIGNENTPENLGPVHNSVLHGDISVYGTVTDDNIESYHFRVVKDGGSEGHTCTEELALFDENNHGHASTTLPEEACGFSYQKAHFITESFTNSLLAIVNTVDLGSFSGEGDYWFILGAKDLDQNRTHENYLEDPRVKIIVDNTAPVTTGTVFVPGLEGPFTVNTSSTDDHGIATTTIYSATSDGLTCQTFFPVTSLAGSLSNISTSSAEWTPEVSGTYCVGAGSTDLPGNVESVKTLATEIHFVAPFVPPTPTSTPTTTPITPTPSPAPAPTPESNPTVGSGSPSGGGGGNGPIVNSFGAIGNGPITNSVVPNQDGTSGSGSSFTGGIGGDGTTLDTDSQATDSQSQSNGGGNDSSGSESLVNVAFASDSDDLSFGTTSEEIGTSSEQLALAGASGTDLNWLWLLILALLIGGGYYIYQKNS
ncbi:MAG: hypothetical protein WAX44_00205 [Minisyncoccia bacterium]